MMTLRGIAEKKTIPPRKTCNFKCSGLCVFSFIEANLSTKCSVKKRIIWRKVGYFWSPAAWKLEDG